MAPPILDDTAISPAGDATFVPSGAADEGLSDFVRRRFATCVADDLATLGRAIASGDAATTKRLAHGVRGSAEFVGASSIAAAAARLEQISAAPPDEDASEASLRFAALAEAARQWISRVA